MFDNDNIADQPTLDEVNHFIQKKHNVSFNGVWMIVVEWRNIHAYPHSFVTNFPNLFTNATKSQLNKVIYNCLPIRTVYFYIILVTIDYQLLCSFIDKYLWSYYYYWSCIINLCNLHLQLWRSWMGHFLLHINHWL